MESESSTRILDDTRYFDTAGFYNISAMYRMATTSLFRILNGPGVNHEVNGLISEEIKKITTEIATLNETLNQWVRGADELELNEISFADIENLTTLLNEIQRLNSGVLSLYQVGREKEDADMFAALPHDEMMRDFENVFAYLKGMHEYVKA